MEYKFYSLKEWFTTKINLSKQSIIMGQKIQDILFDPTMGKIVSLVLGIIIIWTIIKLLKRNLFSSKL